MMAKQYNDDTVSNSNADLVESLETKLAFMEDALDTLSNEFYAQQKTIDTLLLKVQQLQDKVSTIDDANEQGQIVDERPPHY